MRRFITLYQLSKTSGSIFLLFFFKFLVCKIKGKNIVAHHKTKIVGLKNIETSGRVKIGIDYVGFMNNSDKTYLNINGKIIFNGNYSIGKGCRFDIGKNAIVSIGKGGYVNPNTTFIIMHGLKIGNNCSISWNCQFLDEDFHTIDYQGKPENNLNDITIGNNVWIGCNTKIYKGVQIPDGCVITSDSVVKHRFYEENVLIAGNPARVIKRNISWK